MSKHTPGPWTAKVITNSHGGWKEPTQDISISHEGQLIATYDTSYYEYGPDEENLANASLIAAAPDLLEALEEIIEACRNDGWAMNGYWAKKAIAAISKAKRE